jgi:hypothetical protein
LGNDDDVDGDPLAAVLESGPAHGTLALEADGSFSYTPEPDFHGTDGFSYRAGDGNLESDTATVTIEVKAVDDPAPASTPPADTPPTEAASLAPAQPTLAQLRLGSRCVRPSRSGRVRIPITLRMARPGPVQVRIERGVGTRALQSCPRPNPERRFTGRFRKVATLSRLATRAAAAGRRRLTLKLRLAPGLYRLTIRAQLDRNRLSRPARRYLRVLG